jgi:predicted metal-dependent peptidase
MTSEASSAETGALAKLRAARTRLVLERPFLGALALHLPLTATQRCRTVATDARAFYFNPGFIDSLSLAEAQFVLAHEALHCGLLHFDRARQRIRRRWDRACDYAVNQLLVDDGMQRPRGALLDPAYRGLAAEEIYPLLEPERDEMPLDEHWFGGNAEGTRQTGAADTSVDAQLVDATFLEAHRDGFDEVLTRATMAAPSGDQVSLWRDRLAASGIEAASAGRLGSVFRTVLDELLQPRLPWRALLARFLMTLARDDYSFERRSRRAGAAILPGLASGSVTLALALDSSGSIAPQDFAEFITEVDALKGQIRARVTVLACDTSLVPGAPWRFEPWERLALPAGLGRGGGTRFTPVFEWLADEPAPPDALLYFTDALGEFPPHAPSYPVLWLVKGNALVPWGERIQLN